MPLGVRPPDPGPLIFARRGRSGARAGRRGDILDAALECFTSWGYQQTKMEHIGAEAKASIGSIYHHFGSKEQLAAVLYIEGLGDYQRSFLRVIADGGEVEAGIRGIVVNHLRWVEENPKLAQFLLSSREAELVDATDVALRAMNGRVIAATRAWVADAVEAGAMRAMPTGLLYAVLIGPSQEFARQWVGERDPGAMAAAREELPEAAWRAVRA